MLEVLNAFRTLLDDKMLKSMHKRVTLWGNDYSGRFLKWYAEYYHGIRVDFIISLDMQTGQSYEDELYRKSILDFNFKDVCSTELWISEPLNLEDEKWLKSKGFVIGKNLIDFSLLFKDKGICNKNIQFMSYLEDSYGCDLVSAIETNQFVLCNEHAHAYRCTTQKEIFPILDRCHCIPKSQDAIFDFGCGKGAALLSFLDYGFEKVGGVEYDPMIYNICLNNFKRLNLLGPSIQLIQGDAANLKDELDCYNWFYFFQPFDKIIFSVCIKAICDSYCRTKRKIRIISISPDSQDVIIDTGIFKLSNQFSIAMRQKVVDIYENYDWT